MKGVMMVIDGSDPQKTKEYLELVDREFMETQAKIDAEIKAERYRLQEKQKLKRLKRDMWLNPLKQFWMDWGCYGALILAIITFFALLIYFVSHLHFYELDRKGLQITLNSGEVIIDDDIRGVDHFGNSSSITVYYHSGGKASYEDVLRWKPINEPKEEE